MNRTLRFTPLFAKALRKKVKGQPALRQAIKSCLTALAADAFAPALRVHKLKGKLKGLLAVKAGYDLRIVFKIETRADGEEILLVNLGTHDEVYS